jgi:uncharacterized caspase-like protein
MRFSAAFWVGLLTAGMALLSGAAPSVAADSRVALVIGNSIYQHANRLPNPANDALAVADLLKKSGFDVDSRHDLSIGEMSRAIRDFSQKAQNADIAVVYYAGHGIELNGTNFLVPVDAALERDIDVEDETVSLDRIVKLLEPVKRLRLVILDACRDNPFANTMRRTVATRSIGRGLAKYEVSVTDTLVAFAAKAGATASDGDGKNSPFTTALLNNLTTPGVDLRIAFGRVRDEVLRSTNNRQEPYINGSLGGDTVALVPQAAVPADADAKARQEYEFSAQIGTKQAWDSFLAAHSAGIYADFARAQKAKLQAAEQASRQADEARRRAEEQATSKSQDFRKQLEEQGAKQTEEVKKRLTDQAKRELDEERRKVAESSQREVDEARKQADEAKRQADEARQQVLDAKRQAVEDARRQVEEAKSGRQQQIALAVPGEAATSPAPATPAIDPADMRRLLQAHLKRVGCDPDSTDGNWTRGSQKALEQFNKNAGTKFDAKLASLDALDAVRAKTGRVCPLICGKGQKPEGDRCLQISCESGFVLGSNGVCHKKPEPERRAARHEAPAGGGGGGKCFTFNGKRFCE